MTPIEKAAKVEFEGGFRDEKWEDVGPGGIIQGVHIEYTRTIIAAFLDGVLADHNVIARVSDESEQGKTRVRFIVEALKQEASR